MVSYIQTGVAAASLSLTAALIVYYWWRQRNETKKEEAEKEKEWVAVGRVAELFVHPIKSCHAMSVSGFSAIFRDNSN